MIRTHWVLTGLALCLVTLVSCELKYVVTGPKVMRPGSAYIASITTSGSSVNTTFHLTITITNTESGRELVKTLFVLNTGETEVLEQEIPVEVPAGSYTFNAVASNGVAFNKSYPLTLSQHVHSLAIQTDKRLYKPGQTCHFRVIAFDPNLKPFKQEINITIYDTNSNKIIKLVNQKNDYGVITGKLELSDITPLGQWRILAETLYTKEEQFFQVEEYVLPKFEVSVIAPELFFVNVNNPSVQEDLKISVIAKYTYGKLVKGTVNFGIRLQREYYTREEPVIINKLLQLTDGKADISVSVGELSSLLPPHYSLSYVTLFVEANVTEAITGVVLRGSKTVNTKPSRLQLTFLPGSPDSYKPGLPYKAFLALTKLDGSPADLRDLQDSNGFRSLEIRVTNRYPYYDYPRPFPEAPAPRIIGAPGERLSIPRPIQPPPSPSTSTFSVKLDKNGQAFFEFQTVASTESASIDVTYRDELTSNDVMANKYISQFKTRDQGGIQLSVKDGSHILKANTKVFFHVDTVHSVDTIYFQVMAKGLMKSSTEIKSSGLSTSHDFGIMITDALASFAPQVRFVASYITTNGELIADSIALSVEDYLNNKISLSLNKNQTEPGDDSVLLDVDTSTNAFVGLLGVDQSVLLLHAGNDLTRDKVSHEMAKYTEVGTNARGRSGGMGCFDSCFWWPIYLGGSDTSSLLENVGLFVLTNLHIKEPEYPYRNHHVFLRGGMEGPPEVAFAAGAPLPLAPSPPRVWLDSKVPKAEPVVIRKDFPETFIWTDVMSNDQGKVELKVKVPDTITSWVITGFSVNQNLGLGLSDSPAKLTVVKPFFISLNLPYSIIRGEEFALQVTVNNYYGQDLLAEVKLLTSEYFKVISCETKVPENKNASQRVNVANNDASAVYFWIIATSLGQIPIEVTVLAGVAADAMRANLLVKPEGQSQSYSASDFIQLSSGGSYDKQFAVAFPSTGVVPGSAQMEMTLIGDVIGASLDGIEDLLKMPYGCGEQNLLSFAPDVFILHYLKTTSQLTSLIEKKALKYITSGYQRQLTYQRNDYSFSAFGSSDKAGSTWLSAFTIKCFHQAKDFIPIEERKIAKTLEWIMGNQDSNGMFREPPMGKVLHTAMQGGSGTGLSMTAYVAISLIENLDNPHVDKIRLKESINKAIAHLETSYRNYASVPYSLAIISYAFFKANSSELSNILQMLDGLAVNQGGTKHWKDQPEETTTQWRSPYGVPDSNDVELASYVLLVYAQKKDFSASLPIAKWLLSQRNAQGGFASTQDTVMALEALSAFALLIAPRTTSSGISVKVLGASGTVLHTYDQITKQNSLLLQSFQLPANTTSVTVRATGEGVALAQLVVTYNVEVEDRSQNLRMGLRTRKDGEELVLDITARWSGSEVTGMVLVEVNLLTGFEYVDEKNLSSQIGETFKKLEKSHNKIVIYLDELASSPVSFSVRQKNILSVSNVKPALVKLYLYYNPTTVASSFYSSVGGQTWEGACPLCCPSK